MRTTFSSLLAALILFVSPVAAMAHYDGNNDRNYNRNYNNWNNQDRHVDEWYQRNHSNDGNWGSNRTTIYYTNPNVTHYYQVQYPAYNYNYTYTNTYRPYAYPTTVTTYRPYDNFCTPTELVKQFFVRRDMGMDLSNLTEQYWWARCSLSDRQEAYREIFYGWRAW